MMSQDSGAADKARAHRSVFVTGGGKGIGRAIALAFATPGAFVAIASRGIQHLEATAAEIRDRGAEALAIETDVTSEESIDAVFAEYRRHRATLDVLVNNAGLGGGEPVAGSDIARWRRVIETNIGGTYLVTRGALPLMRRGGRVINLSSVLGRFGVPGYTAYCASKHGVIGFTRALALETAPQGITVNAICPGWVETEMAVQGMHGGARAQGITYEQFRERALGAVPIGRIIQPDEVARLVRFLASPDAEAITGQTYNICGGQTMD
jgi:NAD(P)-dependent dehydrogenase (short-subunit alcohol dehydrogenase family)